MRKNRQQDAFDLIFAERSRQIESEGWTPEHDARHPVGELARAARCYAIPTEQRAMFNAGVPSGWPWERRDWKPTPDDRVRELVKAGALYVAETERIRAEVRSIVHAIDDLRGTDSFAGTGPSLWTRLSYWLRPYDQSADRRRWRWRPRQRCGAPPDLVEALAAARTDEAFQARLRTRLAEDGDLLRRIGTGPEAGGG